MSNIDRATAITTWGKTDILPEGDRPVGPDDRKFTEIIKIFARTWPFLVPLIFGYWKERWVRASVGTGASRDTQWSFLHAPPLVTIFVLIGPLTGLLPMGLDWTTDLLLGATALMAATCWGLVFLKGRAQLAISVVLGIVVASANTFAILMVTGSADNFQVGLVSLGCLSMWLVQYRIDGGKIRLRVRQGAHLIYYCVILALSMGVGMITALFGVDVLYTSVLQGRPLTPFMADFIGQPELSVGTVDVPATADKGEASTGEVSKGGKAYGKGDGGKAKADYAGKSGGKSGGKTMAGKGGDESNGAPVTGRLLTQEQRRGMRWLYIFFSLATWAILIPLNGMVLPYYHTWIMQKLNQDLRLALVERWHRLSLRYHGDHRVGDSVYRIYQDSAQVTSVISATLKTGMTVFELVMILAIVAALDPILGILALVVLAVAIGWGRWFSPRMRSYSLVARETNAALTSRIQEIFAAIRVIKAHGMEDVEQQRFESDSVTAFNAASRVRLMMAVITIVLFTVTAASLLSTEFFMATWAARGRETFAAVLIGLIGLSFVRWNLAAFRYGQDQAIGVGWSVRGVLQMWAMAQDMAMGLDRVFSILDIEPDVKNAPDAVPAPPLTRTVRFDNVTFGYNPDQPVLRNVSFAVEPGTVTAIVGPTGSGKSTLMSLLPRLFDPDSGSISIDDVDLRDMDVDSLRSTVSVALQENVLFGMSVRDNIRYVVPDADDVRVRQAAAVACVDDYIAGLPDGLDTVLSDRGGKLSTGQRQRLSISRAIIKDTAILILDEPTAALDAATELKVLERLGKWGEDRAIFLITHRISTISGADKILYLDGGEIVESGSHSELMQLPEGRYRRFVETEAKLSKRSDPSSQTGEEEAND